MMRNRSQLKSPRHAGVGMIIGTAAFAMLAFVGLQAGTCTSVDGGKTFEGELKTYDPESGNTETCTNVGDGMGKAMVGLLKGGSK